MQKLITKLARFIFLFTVLLSVSIYSQTTSFTYQGNLNDGSLPANGSYDFEFSLYDALSGGAQIGSTLTKTDIAVAEGVFSVSLDFGGEFPGAGRWLEIRVKQSTPATAGGFTTLTPRQAVSSAPYAVKSLAAENAITADSATTATNATQLGGISAGQFVITSDSRLSDARTPTSGSGDYIQNTTTQQSSSAFNISGTGIANKFDAATQFDMGGLRILSRSGFQNLFVGIGTGGVTSGSSNSFFGHSAGQLNTTGSSNSFFGAAAGLKNSTASRNSFFGHNAGFSTTTGGSNSFFGALAGQDNTTGNQNAFFGQDAGQSNTTGSLNSFFGSSAGDRNTTGGSNSFFGRGAGFQNTIGASNSFFGTFAGSLNTTGSNNSFFGINAAQDNTTGSSNSFFGRFAGRTNTTGSGNTVIGMNADVASADLTNATALGQLAEVSTSNSLVLGSINGVNSAIADTNVGIGTTAPTERLHIAANSGRILFGDAGCGTGVTAIGFASTLSGCADYALAGNGTSTFINRPTGGSVFIRENNITQVRINSGGTVEIENLGSGGLTGLCRNPSNEISTCSSSIRYKSNVTSFTPGLELIKKLRPVSFYWTEGGMLDVGLVAEEVAEVEPLLTTSRDGKIEGVKYDRVGVVLINAVREQQEQIGKLNEKGKMQNKKADQQDVEIERLRNEVESLKAIVCELKPEAVVCRGTR